MTTSARPNTCPSPESVELMKNRQLDATLQSAGLGVSSFKDLATSLDVQMVAVPRRDRHQARAPYIAATVPAGTTRGRTAMCRRSPSSTFSSPIRRFPTKPPIR